MSTLSIEDEIQWVWVPTRVIVWDGPDAERRAWAVWARKRRARKGKK